MNQLALPIGLADHALFASYYPAGNETTVRHLESIAAGVAAGGAWLRGARGSGKSHLLQATCAAAGSSAVYLPASLLRDAGVALLDGLSSRHVIAIDDIDRLLGDAAWERALFNLWNDLAMHGGQVVAAAMMSPRESPARLPDLASRLTQLPTFALRTPDDEQRLAALELRARQRGLELPTDTARYLLTRARRDMGSLYALLDALDQEAVRAQRRLTVPFVRDVLARDNRPLPGCAGSEG